MSPSETVLFDVDGTLVDSNAAHAQAWAQALREHGVLTDVMTIRPFIGMGVDKLLPAVADIVPSRALGSAVARRKQTIFSALLPSVAPTPGARALLHYLGAQGVEIGIATSADDREMSSLLERAGVDDLIRVRTSSDDARNSKPAPDIVATAIRKAGASRRTTGLVGDTPYDIQAARRAGIPAIALRCGGYWPDSSLQDAMEVLDHAAALLVQWRRTQSAHTLLSSHIGGKHAPATPERARR